jgi:hypothetical protein
VHLGLADDKGNEQGNRSNIWWEKMFAVRQWKYARQTIFLHCAYIKTHGKQFFYRAFLCAVRPKKYASLPSVRKNAHGKRLKRTANIDFPVVVYP